MKEERFRDPFQALVLLVIGMVFLLSGIAMIFTPLSWMADLVQSYFPRGFNRLWPSSPLFFYMIRSMGGFMVWISAAFLIAAHDPGRYKWWIFASGMALLMFSALCAVSGFTYRLPRVIYLGDTLFAFLGGILILRSRPWRRADSEET